jgi:hypothetical protein
VPRGIPWIVLPFPVIDNDELARSCTSMPVIAWIHDALQLFPVTGIKLGLVRRWKSAVIPSPSPDGWIISLSATRWRCRSCAKSHLYFLSAVHHHLIQSARASWIDQFEADVLGVAVLRSNWLWRSGR